MAPSSGPGASNSQPEPPSNPRAGSGPHYPPLSIQQLCARSQHLARLRRRAVRANCSSLSLAVPLYVPVLSSFPHLVGRLEPTALLDRLRCGTPGSSHTISCRESRGLHCKLGRAPSCKGLFARVLLGTVRQDNSTVSPFLSVSHPLLKVIAPAASTRWSPP